MINEAEIVEELEVTDYEVWTDEGWVSINKAFVTIPLEALEIKTSTHELTCAYKHLISAANALTFAEDLKVGDLVNTDTGLEPVTAIEAKPSEPMYDLSISSNRHLYYTNGILSHNSTTLCARQLILAEILPGFRSLYIAPHSMHLETYQNRLREMERNFRYGRIVTGFRSNLGFKEYPNGSVTELIRVDTSAGDARGKTTDDKLFDEFQNFDVTFLPEVEQTSKSSNIPCTMYAGTSLTIDTALETKYQQGSQATWHIKSGDGSKWINCGDPDQVLQLIKPQGPTCPYSGKILNMSSGHFVHAYPARAEAGFTSFHIPQLIIPEYVDNQLKWLEIYKAFKDYSAMGQIKKFLQEILGIPTEDGLREITENDLKEMCVLTEGPEGLKAKAKKGHYKFVVSGIDWGGSDWNPADKTKLSYTVHAIMGTTQQDTMELIHMRKYAGMDYKSIMNNIVKEHLAFNGQYIASDFSAGTLYNLELREQPGISARGHFIMNYGGPETAMFSRAGNSHLFNHYILNRTDSITALFEAIKKEPPRIRCFNWNDAREYLMDFLNLFRIPTESNSGKGTFRYRRHGSKADDTLHAVNFAFTMSRILNNEPLMEDRTLKLEINNILSRNAVPGGRRPSGIVSG